MHMTSMSFEQGEHNFLCKRIGERTHLQADNKDYRSACGLIKQERAHADRKEVVFLIHSHLAAPRGIMCYNVHVVVT